MSHGYGALGAYAIRGMGSGFLQEWGQHNITVLHFYSVADFAWNIHFYSVYCFV